MAADASEQLALAQLGDAEAAVPVTATEQQAAIIGHDQHLGADVHPGGEGAAQEPLGSAQQTGDGGSGRRHGGAAAWHKPHKEIYIQNSGNML